MQYNQSSSLFSCYASASQKGVSIYKLTSGDNTMETHDCNDYAIGAECDKNATCTVCGQEIADSALGHDYNSVVTEPTCTKNGYTTYTCSRCGDDYEDDVIDALGHNFVGDVCEICGEEKPQVGGEKTYTFSDYTAGTQYAEGEEHVLDEYTTIVTYDCYFTSELRIYSSNANNGYAIIKSVNPITKIGVNAGNAADTLVIYGSNDNGATWTEVASIEVTSTSYKDYVADLGSSYEWLKIDVDGTNQVRLKSVTLTTTEPCEHTNTTTTTVDATCTEAGSITVTCDDCKKVISTEELPIIDHTYVEGTCSVCGATEGGSSEPTVTTVSKSHIDIAGIAGVSTSGGNINGKEIKLDDNISIVCDKGSSTSNPAIYSESIRLYQNGATLTIKGTGMKTIIITLANNAAGDGPIAVTGGTADNASAPTNYVYTITVNEGVSEVVITTEGTDTNSRLYVANIEVTYEK